MDFMGVRGETEHRGVGYVFDLSSEAQNCERVRRQSDAEAFLRFASIGVLLFGTEFNVGETLIRIPYCATEFSLIDRCRFAEAAEARGTILLIDLKAI